MVVKKTIFMAKASFKISKKNNLMNVNKEKCKKIKLVLKEEDYTKNVKKK